jgi:glyoxylase-like metal-dependent hydrolase (beta-lactamase superfamily II)
MLETNCYVVWDAESREALIIDPGGNPEIIMDCIRENDLMVKGIVDTHGHADHIAANRILRDQLNCPIIVHELDAGYLVDPRYNLSEFIGVYDPISPKADRLVKDGDEISIGQILFRVIHTPGHTPGGICLLYGSSLFAGDTLFAGSVGRSDFPGGSHSRLIQSIREKLLPLPDATIVYTGHGPDTTIGEERECNPFL